MCVCAVKIENRGAGAGQKSKKREPWRACHWQWASLAGPPAQAPPGNPPAVSAAAVAGHCCPGAATGTQLGHLGILGG